MVNRTKLGVKSPTVFPTCFSERNFSISASLVLLEDTLVKVLQAIKNPISEIEKSWKNGDCEVEIIPQGTLIERIRAAGAGIPAFYTPTGVGTIVAKNKEHRNFNNRTFLLEKALTADFALIRANRSDTFGNLEYIGTSRAFNPAMATASKITIAEVNEIVGSGEMDPEKVGTPGVYVNRIVKRKFKDPYP